jgi:uncharacterized protein
MLRTSSRVEEVPVPGAVHGVEDMDRATCRSLLASVPFGRIASTDRGLPKIVPVHCTVRGEEIVIGTLRAHINVRLRHGDVVAFEADAYDSVTREGWSVGLVGPCRVVTDPTEVDELDALDFTPWTVEDGAHYIALPLGHLSGRALTRRRSAAASDGAVAGPAQLHVRA